ncbi:hypothetical protein RJ639_040645 [Escallonia herrerae]|uniref:Pyrrolo-quinoline quinone repeat domain-containing protein n=1 Tax=Escallonia herrerae TaxID=1293975 RepID=A0AA88WK16_9ASTE|nr:hypothetical protein RJ639_040645 [Escallonia herrerae]
MLLTISSNGKMRDIVVAVQKNGFSWALDRENASQTKKFRRRGGHMGAASEGERGYTNIVTPIEYASDLHHPIKQYTYINTTIYGAWVALEANTGQILWFTVKPSNESAQGPVTLVNGVLFAGSVAPNGPIYAMDANTGTILWSYNTGVIVYGGASASYGCIYIGNGFKVGLAKFHHDLDFWSFTLCLQHYLNFGILMFCIA